MLKLFSLEGFLSLSSDAVKKLKTELGAFGIADADKFDDVDDFIDAAVDCIDNGDTVILAAENDDYNAVKKQIINTFSLRHGQSESVQDRILDSKSGFTSSLDTQAHCLVPLDADIYMTADGLFCGFCVEFSNDAKMILVPLDNARLDDILVPLKKELGGGESGSEHLNYNDGDMSETGTQIDSEEPAVTENISGANGEPEYEDNFSGNTIKDTTDGDKDEPKAGNTGSAFDIYDDEDEDVVLTLKSGEELIVDDSADEADLTGFENAMSVASKTAYSLINLDKRVVFVASQASPFLLAMQTKVDGLSDSFSVCDIEKVENEEKLEIQVALAKKTRLAMSKTGADFGAAISPVIKEEKDGKDIYYSYIIIHDGVSAKAKKVSTSTQQGVESLIPHAFSVMFGLIGRKAESIYVMESDISADDDKDKRKKKLMLAASIIAASIAIISAFVMVWSYFQRTPEILNSISQPENNINTPSTSSTNNFATSTPTITTTGSGFNYPLEPTAGDISVIPSSTPFSSNKGVFTFTVYGYGHGVGMSQTGADYYASLGKTYIEILTIYYYGVSLAMGDTTPATVKYNGETYTLRDYLAKAVESEMGSSYNPEALKAQAVAIYTFAKYYNFDVPVALHAFSKEPSQKSYDAVDAVTGQFLIYEGKPARAFFHATSAGKTTSYTNVFGSEQIPYLAGGRPSYGDINANGYCTTVTMTSDQLSALIYSKTGIQLTGDPANWLKILSHDGCINENTGYVSKIQVGDQAYTGNDFRIKVLGGAIRSHCFTFIYTPTA